MSVVPFKNRDGSLCFTCVDCGALVLAAVPEAVYDDEKSVCLSCQFIRNNPALMGTSVADMRLKKLMVPPADDKGKG